MITIRYNYGSVILNGKHPFSEDPFLIYDQRIDAWRAEASHYGPIVDKLRSRDILFDDQAGIFSDLSIHDRESLGLRPYQEDALAAWKKNRCRGVVVLPTGAGKTIVALAAVAHIRQSTLVVVPTLDLMEQWARRLEEVFRQPVGLLGGGSKEAKDITVSTYESACLTMEFIGNRFGLIIFDECHHVPSERNRIAATMCLAPYRLGLTATPERQDGMDAQLDTLLGPICYRREIDEMEGAVLAPYLVHQIKIHLKPQEAEAYRRHRKVYVDFVREKRIHFSSPAGWRRFLILCAREPGGREVFESYLQQKKIARNSLSKYEAVWKILKKHAGEKIVIFTAENQVAYEMGRRFFLPVITHQTRIRERKEFLEAFRRDTFPVLVSSNVLNEGIDVPEVGVGIVVSGTGSIREHVQRLGRLLRPSPGKQAHLYELVSGGTSEESVSYRRSQHRAYQRSS